VYGKDVLRHDSIASLERNYIHLDVIPNTNYFIKFEKVSDFAVYNVPEITPLLSYGAVNGSVFNSGTNSKASINMRTKSSGTFDFIKPQLFALDGRESQLYGKPVSLVKQSKRSLYAKR
jgi:hypothetical protein